MENLKVSTVARSADSQTHKSLLPFVRLAQSEWAKSFIIGVFSSITATLILAIFITK